MRIKVYYSDVMYNVFVYFINDGKNFVVRYDDDGELKGLVGKFVFKVI